MSRLEKRGPSALEAWARQKTDGYNGVTIRNMTTSWRNGLAFCALIHRFRPDLIEYEKLDPRDILGNCALAFEVAERQLGIPALLDPEDMVNHEVPDRLSVLTYVAQFYNTFKSLEKKSNVTSRLSISPDENVIKARPVDNSNPTSPEKVKTPAKRTLDLEDEIMNEARKRVPTKSVMLNSANACSECKNPVFLSERILFAKKLYHRSCFRCFNCKHILNPHTAEVSPDGLLFCLENACHVELRKRSESAVNISINNGSRPTSVNSDDRIVNEPAEKPPRSENIVPTTNMSNENPSPPTPRKISIQAKFPPFNGQAPEKENPVITNYTVKDRVAALRNKFLDECHAGDDELSRSRPSSLKQSRERVRGRSKSRSRSRSRSRSPAQISVGMAREPSDVLVNAPYSDYVKCEPMDEVECEDEGISSLDDRGGDSNSRLEVNAKVESQIPEVLHNIAVHSPGMLSVAEQLAANAKVISNVKEKELQTGASVLRKINNSSSPPTRIRLIEGSDELRLSEIKKVPTTPPPKIPLEEKSETQKTPTPSSSPKIQKFVLSDITEKVPEVPPVSTNTGETQTIVLTAKQESETDHSTEDEYFEAPSIQESEPEAEVVQIVNPSPEVSNLAAEEPAAHIIVSPTPEIKILSSPTPEKPKVDEPHLTSTPVSTPSPSPRKREKAPPPPRPAPPKQMQKAATKESTKEVWKKKNYYPAELNPFESEEQFVEPPKNPFEDEDGEEETIPTPVKASPTPTPRARSSNRTVSKDVSRLRSRSRSPVPELISQAPPSPKPRTTVTSSTPVIESRLRPSNPFEDDEEGDESGVSVRAGDETSSTCSRLSDGSSFNSSIGGSAHPTPKPRDRDSIISNATETNSMKLKSRKNKRAPLPPSFMGQVTPEPKPLEPPKSPKSILKNSQSTMNGIGSSNLDKDGGERSGASSPSPKKLIPASPKLLKGLKNHANLAVAQQYKKKRRAPPPRRRVEPLPEAAIKTELEDLSIQERELERQGITLESNIRRLMDDDADNDQVDDMMVQLWSIVDEKNDILRRQTELEFLRRGHHLEEMQADLEFQLRILMDTPTNQRQDDHTYVEDALLEEMLKIVDERNEVVEWLDFHRKQDHDVSQSMNSFTSTNRKSDANGTSQKEEEVVHTTLPRTKSKKSKGKDKQSKNKKEKDSPKVDEKSKDKDDRKIKFGTLFGRKKNKGKKDKLDEDKDLDESLSAGSR